MKICMFTNTYLPHVGGVARSVATFAEDLKRLGHRIIVVAPTFPDQSDSEQSEIPTLRVPAIQNFNGSDFSVRIPLPGIIDDEINDFDPDIIHSHHPFLLGDTALRTARTREVPLFFTHHTLYERYTHYVPLDSEGMKRFVINLATEYANLCNRVIAPSGSVAELLRQRGVTAPVTVLPTGVDLELFQAGRGDRFRKKYDISEKLVVGHVGRLAREKNLPYLATAVAGFLKQRPGACFLLAGKGDAEKEIVRIFEKKGLADRLYLPGVLQDGELADAYCAMDLFVFASQSETQGMVLVEAMAAGVPVIALDASGVRDVLKNGTNGLLLPSDTSEEDFAGSLAEAASGPSRLDQWRHNALETARRLSRRQCALRLAELYENALAEKPPLREKIDVLEALGRAIKTEWDLFQEKTSAAARTFSIEPKQR